MKKRRGEPQTWRESDIRDDVLAVVEGHQVLEGVRVHDEEAAVIQAYRQGFAIGGEAAAAAACGGWKTCLLQPWDQCTSCQKIHSAFQAVTHLF